MTLRVTSNNEWICFTAGGFKKIFWVLVMMGMAAVLLYNVVELTKKYLSYPIRVKFSVDHQQQLTFPAVAICNMSPIKKSSLEAAQSVKRRKKRSAGTCILSRLFPIVFTENIANIVMNETINKNVNKGNKLHFGVKKPFR